MTLLPVVARELRVASRKGATYWTRFTFAALAVVIGSFAFAILTRESPRRTGLGLFVTLSVIAYIYSILAGALSTADSVSEEKREGTLGLLFLTDLRAYDIVLGKIAASSITSIYGLLAIFPIMAIPLLLGGVAAVEFWRVVLVCLNNLFLSLGLGILCSALCKDERKAIGLTILLLLLLTAGWPALIAWVASQSRPGDPFYTLFNQNPQVLLTPSPGFAAFTAFDDTYKAIALRGKNNWFAVSLGLTHALGWICLALTTLILPRVWQDRAASAQTVRRRASWRDFSLGNAEARREFRRAALPVNPVYWLSARERFKTVLVWLWLVLAAGLWTLGLLDSRQDWLSDGVYLWTAICAHGFFKCWVAMEASRRLGLDRRSGALELLLSTPLSVREILQGQWLALLRQFGAAVALIIAVDFLFLGLGLKQSFFNNERATWIVLWLAGVAIFVFDLITLTLLGMWSSLSGQKTSQAGLSAIVRVCVLPWFLFGALCAFLAVLEEILKIRPFGTNPPGYLFIGLWFLLSCACNTLFSLWSYRRLTRDFRAVATERIESRAAFWGRWLGRQFAQWRK